MYKKKFNLKCRGDSTGFSLTELMVVVAVIGILALMATPLFMELVAKQRVQYAAKAVAATTQQARLLAANTQKPIRVVLDCSAFNPATNGHCLLTMQSAVYRGGAVTGWTEVPSTRHELADNVTAIVGTTGTSDVPDGAGGIRAGIFWAIFMPSGQVFSNPRPFNLGIVNHVADQNLAFYANSSTNWRLDVSNITGRTIVNRLAQ